MQSQSQQSSTGKLKKPTKVVPTTVTVVEEVGDLFVAAEMAARRNRRPLLIHSCNCKGEWGPPRGGTDVASQMKERYPVAFQVYKDFVENNNGHCLGRGLLIPPQDGEIEEVFIGCLFVSQNPKPDKADDILRRTKQAMQELMDLVKAWSGIRVGEAHMCKINAGAFKVPWDDTKAELEKLDIQDNTLRRVFGQIQVLVLGKKSRQQTSK